MINNGHTNKEVPSLTHPTLVGNWATLLLATDREGTIDYARLGEEIDVLISSSPCGIYSNGTAGEFYTQSEEEFRKGTLRNVIHKYFNNSYLSVVSSLVEEEDISLDELKQLIADVER